MPVEVVTVSVTSLLAGSQTPDFGKAAAIGRVAARAADGVTTALSSTVTSATAAFTTKDVDKKIVGADIPANATILSVTNATTVVISAAATATGSGISLWVGINQPIQYIATSQIDTNYGSGSDLSSSLGFVFGAGSQSPFGVMAKQTVVVDSAALALDAGTLPGTTVIDPWTPPTVTNNAVSKTVVYTVVSPPTTPAANQIALNPYTREWKAAETATGTGIIWTHTEVDYASAYASLVGSAFFIVYLAQPANGATSLLTYGAIKSLQVFCDANDKVFTFDTGNATGVTNGQLISTALGASRNGFGAAHKSSDDVAAIAAGSMSITKPWSTMLYKPATGITQTQFYLTTEVGSPDVANTFEGGDANSLGPLNVVVNVQGQNVFSNGLTTAGLSSSYPFIDITRTRYYCVDRIITALRTLRLSVDKIPYTDAGLLMVQTTLNSVLTQLVTVGALSPASTVTVPPLASIPAADRNNRILQNIVFRAVLAGDVHKFVVSLVLTSV